jgi:TolA protein
LVQSDRSHFLFGFTVSTVGHVLLAAVMLFQLGAGNSLPIQQTVYSVTLEGGKTLGGIGQVAKTDKKEPIAPPKKVQAPPPKKNEATKKEKVKTEPKKEKPVEKAEVSLKEKKKPEPKKTETKSSKTVSKEPTKQEIDKRLEAAMQRYLGESSEAGGKGFGAARIGGSGMGGGTLLPAEALMYRDLLKNRIKEGWRWYDTSAALTTGVTFDISPSGEISNVVVVNTSGNRVFDDSVLRAIYKASPVPAPPEKVYEYFRKVRMVFDPREL